MAHDEMISRPSAVERVLALREQRHPRATERVPLDRIDGRTLAEEITATADYPPQSHATMDGFAFDATEDYPLEVVDEVFPEDDPPSIAAGEAVRIATGAPLPPEANAVLKREEAEVEDGSLSGAQIEPGTYAYEQGSNVEAGETLFEPGERLAPHDAILLKDVAHEEAVVYERWSAGVLATGTEIHEGRSADLDSPMLVGSVRAWGHQATYEGTVPDEYDRVVARIEAVADTHDIVITTGGTSVGKKDHVIRALEDLGDLHFHAVRIRPGKPIGVATLPDHDAVAFAIPGKPVGAYTIATAVMRPFFTGRGDLPGIDAAFGRDVAIPTEGFEYWIPVVFEDGADSEATPTAMPLGHVDSALPVYDDTFDPSVLSSSTRAAQADYVVVTETDLAAGQDVTVHPYAAMV